jgi:hypothetical protein
MENIVRTVKRQIVSYQCDTCKTQYSSKRAARKCERRKLEEKQFKVGSRVETLELRICAHGQDLHYTARGRITEIIGPCPSDEEYELKWLGGKRLNYHVWKYTLAVRCPHCKRTERVQYYAPELRRIRPARRRTRA